MDRLSCRTICYYVYVYCYFYEKCGSVRVHVETVVILFEIRTAFVAAMHTMRP